VVDAAGDVTAVWELEEGGISVVQSASHHAGEAWGPPRDIGSAGEVAEAPPQVAGDAAGDVTVVWEHEVFAQSVVETASRAAGGAWSPPSQISISGQEARDPRLAVDAGGDTAATWEAIVGGEEIVQSASRPAGGPWSTPVAVTAAGEEGALAEVGIDTAGNVTAAWERTDAATRVIRESDRGGSGSWSAPRRLSPSGVSSFAPEVAVDPGGDAAVAWQRNNGAEVAIEAAARSGLGPWGSAVPVSPSGAFAQLQKVGIDAAGNAILVWREGKLPSTAIDAAARPAGGVWGSPVVISTPGGEDELPQLTVDPGGDAIAVWERFDGADSAIQSAAFDAVGPSLRSLSIPSSGTVGTPVSFSVSAQDAISPVVATTWTFGDGGSAATAGAGHAYAAPGTYLVTVNAVDAVGNTSSASGQVTISAAPTKAPAPGRAGAGRLIRVKGGKALITLSCPAGGGDCAGRAKLSVGLKAKPKVRARSRPGHRRLVLGAAAFSIAAGRHQTVALKLTAKGMALVRKAVPGGLAARLEGSGLQPREVLMKQSPLHHRHRRHPGAKRGGR
jgi:hypothetical protein